MKNGWPELQDLFQKCESDDILNTDEMGLFLKMLPSKTAAFKDDPCKGGKLHKEGLTVLMRSNVSGMNNLWLLIVGKSANHRRFWGYVPFLLFMRRVRMHR